MRRLPLALLALLLVGALFVPAASLACEARGHRCPGMPPELAKLCHQAGSMAPDCCKNERPAPTRRGADETGGKLGAALAAHAEAPDDVVRATPAAAAIDRRGASRATHRHALGLFTLHAVFRI